MSVLNKNHFLNKYNIDESQFKRSLLSWDELNNIYTDYILKKEILKKLEKLYYDKIDFKYFDINNIKVYYKSRIKNEENFIAKIIRDESELTTRKNINLDNYLKNYNDLIGLRLVCLKKDDRIKVLEKIVNDFSIIKIKWFFSESNNPLKDDKYKELIEKHSEFIELQMRDKKTPYDSIHVRLNNFSTYFDINIEIQIRTIFEEAWGEVDHDLKYPYKMDDKFLISQMSILNSLAQCSDDIISFVYDYKDLIINPKRAKEDYFTYDYQMKKLNDIFERNNIEKSVADEIKQIFKKETYQDGLIKFLG